MNMLLSAVLQLVLLVGLARSFEKSATSLEYLDSPQQQSEPNVATGRAALDESGQDIDEIKRAGSGWTQLNGGWGKRENWNKLNAVWGKRPERNWNNLSGMWGKRAPQWNNLQGMIGKRAAPQWNNLHGMIGKRASPQWNSMQGMIGKRSPQTWNNLSGMWGKRSGLEEADNHKTGI